jgi:DNA-binding HxlR family transcriptional regulator
MQKKTFRHMICPVARTLDRVGEWWSMLILRDAFQGLTRFDQFQTSLEIAPNMLTRRLNALVEDGMLERQLYSKRPERYEYLLTDKGRDFWSVLAALSAYGNRYFADEGIASRLVDVETGKPVEAIVVDRASGKPIDHDHTKFGPGPAADSVLRTRMRFTDARRQNQDGREEWGEYVRQREERDKQASRPRRAVKKARR